MHSTSIGLTLRRLGIVTLGIAGLVAALSGPEPAGAQIRNGNFWLVQPHQTARVGRAWANPERTVEYWAYIQGEYRWADVGNGPGQRWKLEAEFAGDASYANFAAFRDATLALPEFDGKTLVFQDHSVTETVVEN